MFPSPALGLPPLPVSVFFYSLALTPVHVFVGLFLNYTNGKWEFFNFFVFLIFGGGGARCFPK